MFHRITRIQRAGEEASISNEIVVIPFMTRLLEVFASWLDETEFWRGIEDGPQLLGPIGVQQVYYTDALCTCDPDYPNFIYIYSQMC